MTTTNNHRFDYLIAALIALVIAFFLGRGCEREPVEKLEQLPSEVARQKAVNVDSLKSYYESQYREKLQIEIDANKALYTEWQANYKPVAQKATKSVIQYQKTPTLANCDSAVTKLVSQVSELETGIAISDTIIAGQGRVITSYAGTVARKDSVITDLNVGWQEANAENAKLTRKVKRKNTLLKISGGILAVLGIIVAAK